MKKTTTLLTALAVICFFGTTAFALDIGGDIKVMAYYSQDVSDINNDAQDEEAYLRTETHLWFKADLSDNVTTKISVETDRLFDQQDEENPGAPDNDLEVFLEEAWIQMMYLYDSAMSVKLGRQFIEFGDGFVIGDSNPFSESDLNSKGEWEVDPFDAILGWYDGDDYVLNALYAKAVENRLTNMDTDLYGLYFTYTGVEDYVFDVYGFMINMKDDTLGLGSNDAQIYLVGARIAGSAIEGLSYKLEGNYEFGDVDDLDLDIKAWAIEAGAKYMFDAEYNPWVGLTYVYLSGDDDPADDDWEAYVAPFMNRTYGEIADIYVTNDLDVVIGGAHIFNLAAGLEVNEDVAVSAKYYYLMAAEDDPYAGEDKIGHELDAFLDYTFSEETTATVAAGVFLPDDAAQYIKETNQDDEAWFVRAGVKVEF